MLLDDEIEKELCISESEYEQRVLLYIALQHRCENCEKVLRDKYNGGISNGDFFW